MKFQPTDKRLLVKPDPREKETESGIIIPDTVKEERPVSGKIVVGWGDFKKGSRILFSKYGYDDVVLDEETFCVTHVDNVLGTFL